MRSDVLELILVSYLHPSELLAWWIAVDICPHHRQPMHRSLQTCVRRRLAQLPQVNFPSADFLPSHLRKYLKGLYLSACTQTEAIKGMASLAYIESWAAGLNAMPSDGKFIRDGTLVWSGRFLCDQPDRTSVAVDVMTPPLGMTQESDHKLSAIDVIHQWNMLYANHSVSGGIPLCSQPYNFTPVNPYGCIRGVSKEDRRNLCSVADYLYEKNLVMTIPSSRFRERKERNMILRVISPRQARERWRLLPLIFMDDTWLLKEESFSNADGLFVFWEYEHSLVSKPSSKRSLNADEDPDKKLWDAILPFAQHSSS